MQANLAPQLPAVCILTDAISGLCGSGICHWRDRALCPKCRGSRAHADVPVCQRYVPPPDRFVALKTPREPGKNDNPHTCAANDEDSFEVRRLMRSTAQ